MAGSGSQPSSAPAISPQPRASNAGLAVAPSRAAAEHVVADGPTFRSRHRPVFKMKRTGHGYLPQINGSQSHARTSSARPSFHDAAAEPEPAMIVSDILPTQPPSTPAMDTGADCLKPSSVPDGTRKTKYAIDEERRRATSLALKRMS